MSLLVATEPSEENVAFADGNSWGPFAVGTIAGVSNVSETIFIAGLLVYEALQQGEWFEKVHKPESTMNKLGDVAFGLLGYAAGVWIRAHKPDWLVAAAHTMDSQV